MVLILSKMFPGYATHILANWFMPFCMESPGKYHCPFPRTKHLYVKVWNEFDNYYILSVLPTSCWQHWFWQISWGQTNSQTPLDCCCYSKELLHFLVLPLLVMTLGLWDYFYLIILLQALCLTSTIVTILALFLWVSWLLYQGWCFIPFLVLREDLKRYLLKLISAYLFINIIYSLMKINGIGKVWSPVL